MNPFNLNKKYDSYLAQILSKITKSTAEDSCEDLLKYLPEVDINSEIQIILKTLVGKVETASKLTINKILYFLLKKLCKKRPNSIVHFQNIQVPWIYYNFDSEDEYSKKIFENYFNISNYNQLESFIKYANPIRDLEFFIFLIKNSPEEHYFNIKRIELQTYYEFELIYGLLKTIINKFPLKIMEFDLTAEPENEKYMKILYEAFYRIKSVTTPIFLNYKHRILLEIYDYVDESIYEESKNLDCHLLKKLVDKEIEHDKLRVSNINQMNILIPKLIDKQKFLLRNAVKSMCIFELRKKLQIDLAFIKDNLNIFSDLINNSVNNHFLRKICHCKNFNTDKDAIKEIRNFLKGKYLIIIASVLQEKLNPDEFSITDIEEVMEYSVQVFPKEFFHSHTFNATIIPFLKKYPDELERPYQELEFLISKFTKTKKEQILKIIDNIDTLILFLGLLSQSEILNYYMNNVIQDNFKVAFLYYLRASAPAFDVDYNQVFEKFLDREFLYFLIARKNNLKNFVEVVNEYLKKLDIVPTIFFTGYNFDEDAKFYCKLEFPKLDELLKLIYNTLNKIYNKKYIVKDDNLDSLDSHMHIIFALLKIFLYKPVELQNFNIIDQDNFNNFLSKNFYLEKNNFIVERLKRELFNNPKILISGSTLKLNNKKAMDVILRYFKLNVQHLHYLDSSFLSNKALESVINIIVESFGTGKNNLVQNSHFSWALEALSNLNIENERLVNIAEIEFDRLFKIKESNGLIDFIYIIENDKVLQLEDFREERIMIYLPFIDLISAKFTETFLNLYSFSKLESNISDKSVFELIIGTLIQCKTSFWIFLVTTIYQTNNIHVAMFIEKMVLRELENLNDNYFKDNGIVELKKYLLICSKYEFDMFVLTFPNVFNRYGRSLGRAFDLKSLIKESISVKIENSKISFSETNENYQLRMIYRIDSIEQSSTITVPKSYPIQPAKIDFEHKKSKKSKFFCKLNELLTKTSKFTEVFILWKMDIDNHIAGYTECMICYYIMEPKYKSLPNFKCKNCDNIYHDKCILKWISESKNRTCPLCRTSLDLD